ncbi:MAG: hypothetical protein HFI63_08340 [Lachnospiraceae bacterium]|nr:hypothetical protein [Lachnospiraceae bacterium]
MQSASAPRNLQQSSGQSFSANIRVLTASAIADVAAIGLSDSVSASIASEPASPSTADLANADIPLITFSSFQGDVNNIGQATETPMLEEDYLVMLDSAMGALFYYNQGDSHWANYLYGGVDPMSQYGCGPTVVAMLINSFTSYTVTPIELAEWSAANGFHSPHNGSRHAIIPNALSAYGLQVESVAETDPNTAAELLRSGHVLIALMGKGTFSTSGHFVIITNILENGNVRIADSYNFENSKMEWNLESLLAELKHSDDGGGPLWAVTYPESN